MADGIHLPSLLRAMASNYSNGHSWDHLDGEAVTKAAGRIDALEAENARLRDELHAAGQQFEQVAARSALKDTEA